MNQQRPMAVLQRCSQRQVSPTGAANVLRAWKQTRTFGRSVTLIGIHAIWFFGMFWWIPSHLLTLWNCRKWSPWNITKPDLARNVCVCVCAGSGWHFGISGPERRKSWQQSFWHTMTRQVFKRSLCTDMKKTFIYNLHSCSSHVQFLNTGLEVECKPSTSDKGCLKHCSCNAWFCPAQKRQELQKRRSALKKLPRLTEVHLRHLGTTEAYRENRRRASESKSLFQCWFDAHFDNPKIQTCTIHDMCSTHIFIILHSQEMYAYRTSLYQHDMQTIADICLYTEDVCRQIPVYVQNIHSLYVICMYTYSIYFLFLFTIQ